MIHWHSRGMGGVGGRYELMMKGTNTPDSQKPRSFIVITVGGDELLLMESVTEQGSDRGVRSFRFFRSSVLTNIPEIDACVLEGSSLLPFLFLITRFEQHRSKNSL